MDIPSKTFDHFNKLAAEITKNHIGTLTMQMTTSHERQQEFMAVLTDVTLRFVTTGIGEVPERRYNSWWVKEGQRTYFKWGKYFAGLAKDLKRPYVYLTDWNYLHISRRKYTEPLVAGFLLVGNRADWHTTNHMQMSSGGPTRPIIWRRTSGNWYFAFHGDEGREILRAWKASCATDPVKRRALRLAS